MNCPKCKSSYFFLTSNNSKYMKCRRCGYGSTSIAPTYDSYHDERYSYQKRRTEKNDPLIALLFKNIEIEKDDYVLDYGCGAGDLLACLATRTSHVSGSDINITKAKGRFPNLNLIKQETFYLPAIKNNTFDFISDVNVIEHISDFEGMLAELQRVLKPKGKIFITTYDTNFPLHRILNDPTHVIEWSQKDFARLLSKFFLITKTFRSGSFFNYMPFNGLIVKFLKPEIGIIAINRK